MTRRRPKFGFDLDAIREALQQPAPPRDRPRYDAETACPECGAPVTTSTLVAGLIVDAAGPNAYFAHGCAYPPERGTGLARVRAWLKGRQTAEPAGERTLWTESETTAA